MLFRAADVAGNAAAGQEVKFAAVAVPSETGKPSASATPSATATTAIAGSSQQAAATQDAQTSGELASTGAGDSLAWSLGGGLMLVLGGLVLSLRKSARAWQAAPSNTGPASRVRQHQPKKDDALRTPPWWGAQGIACGGATPAP
ncbi:MAG: LPXTG cell wall anchor domain-containing protein [Specibacter sp.]